MTCRSPICTKMRQKSSLMKILTSQLASFVDDNSNNILCIINFKVLMRNQHLYKSLGLEVLGHYRLPLPYT